MRRYTVARRHPMHSANRVADTIWRPAASASVKGVAIAATTPSS